jgi:hypothetical protein
MFDTPLDGIVLWMGLSVASLAALGVAVGLPTTSAPDAAGLADAVDRVAASPWQATARVPIEAEAIRLGSTRLSLRSGGRTSHASFAVATATPVGDGQLRRVLRGRAVSDVFDSQREFRRALSRYPVRPIEWRDAPPRLRVRRVTWGEVDATLVG